MFAVAMREDGGDGERSGGVTGGKAAVDADVRNMAVEEGVAERSGGRDVRGPQAARGDLQHDVEDGGIGVGFSGEERGLFCVGIVGEMPDDQKSGGDCGDFAGGDGTGKYFVESVEGRGAAKVAGVVGISDDKASGQAGYRERGDPLVALGELHRKQPDVFLIFQKITGEGTPGDVALRERRG